MILRARSYDVPFLVFTGLLIVSGFFILTSASLGLSAEKFGHPYYYTLHQMLFGFLPGLIFLFAGSRIPYRYLRSWALPLMVLSIGLMILVFVPSISLYHAGARRWLSFGVFSFQPAELLKFSFIVYLAAWLESKAKHIGSFTFGLLPFAIMSSMVAALLIRQPDFGTLMVLLAAVGALFFVSGGHIKQLALLVIIGMIVLGVLVAIEPYRLSRISVFLNPSYDVRGAGYQIHQALIAVGSGGVFGKGFGLSAQKFGYLPEPIGDSIFAVLAEELGFVGSSALLILFLLFFVRGISIMQRVPDFFSQLLGTGFLFVITFQAITNIAAIIGLIPLTGIPLSFISYGGSSLAIMMAEVGIIINISRYRI